MTGGCASASPGMTGDGVLAFPETTGGGALVLLGSVAVGTARDPSTPRWRAPLRMTKGGASAPCGMTGRRTLAQCGTEHPSKTSAEGAPLYSPLTQPTKRVPRRGRGLGGAPRDSARAEQPCGLFVRARTARAPCPRVPDPCGHHPIFKRKCHRFPQPYSRPRTGISPPKTTPDTARARPPRCRRTSTGIPLSCPDGRPRPPARAGCATTG